MQQIFYSLKIYAFCAFLVCYDIVKALLKMCLAILKVLLVIVMFAAMVWGCSSAFLAVGPQHTPSWMLPAWNMLNKLDPVCLSKALVPEALPLWNIQDSAVVISKWMAQMSPTADLLATFVGLAKEHWLRTEVNFALQQLDTLMKSEPKVGQAICGAWIVSTVSIFLLTLRTLIATARFGVQCVHWVARGLRPARAATTEAAATAQQSDGSGPTPKDIIAEASQALGESTSVNIPSTRMIRIVASLDQMDDKKSGKKRIESPANKTIKARMNASRKEDVPPTVASPLRKKHSELNDLREKGIVGRRLRGY